MKSMYIYGGILIVSLGASWAQWKKEPSLVSGAEVVVLYGDADKIESLVWDSEKNSAFGFTASQSTTGPCFAANEK